VISLVTLQLISFGYRYDPMTTKQQALAVLQATSRFGGMIGPPTTNHASEKIHFVYFITTQMVYAWCRGRAIQQYQTTTDSMGPTNHVGGWSLTVNDDHSDTGRTISYTEYNEVDFFYNAVVASVDNEVAAVEDSQEDNRMLDFADDIVTAVVNDILASE
jgi:hypothetical protein